jgi:uncharacterized DUF497 family protein
MPHHSGAAARPQVRKTRLFYRKSASLAVATQRSYVDRVFRGFTLTAEDDREAYGESRFLTLGLLADQVVSVAHTERGDLIRIISIRKATKHEARFYFSQIPY